ncbi:ABC transporter permease [Salinispira pacifica]
MTGGVQRAGRAASAVAVFGLLWVGLSLLLGRRILPFPWTVVRRFVELFPVPLLAHMAASLARVVAALAVSFAVALPLGIAMGRVKALDWLLSPASYLLFPVPKIALLPVVLLVFGLGNVAKVFLVMLVLFFQILTSVRDAAKGVDRRYLLSFRSLGGSRIQSIRFVILPALLPSLFTALRVGSGTALAVLFFAETFFTRFGLGYFIMDSWTRVAYLDMYVGIMGLSLLGLGIFAALDLAERLLCGWKSIQG